MMFSFIPRLVEFLRSDKQLFDAEELLWRKNMRDLLKNHLCISCFMIKNLSWSRQNPPKWSKWCAVIDVGLAVSGAVGFRVVVRGGTHDHYSLQNLLLLLILSFKL